MKREASSHAAPGEAPLLPELFGAARRLPEDLAAYTPARLALPRAGNRVGTQPWLRFREDHAAARDAVYSALPEGWPEAHGLRPLASRAPHKQSYLLRPDLGARLNEESEQKLRALAERGRRPDLQLVVGDGLSALAVEKQAPPLLKALREAAETLGWTLGAPLFVRFARVAVMDHVAEVIRPRACAILIGERPGLLSAESLSIYAAWEPSQKTTHAERNCISNIHAAGTPPAAAAAHLFRLIQAMREQRVSGVRLLTPPPAISASASTGGASGKRLDG